MIPMMLIINWRLPPCRLMHETSQSIPSVPFLVSRHAAGAAHLVYVKSLRE